MTASNFQLGIPELIFNFNVDYEQNKEKKQQQPHTYDFLTSVRKMLARPFPLNLYVNSLLALQML